MSFGPTHFLSRDAFALRSLTLRTAFLAGMLVAATPAISQGGPHGDDPPGCSVGGGGPVDNDPTGNGCPDVRGVPAPLAAAGIPALAVLAGGFIAVRKKRRRENNCKK